jgi:hypothetical protein
MVDGHNDHVSSRVLKPMVRSANVPKEKAPLLQHLLHDLIPHRAGHPTKYSKSLYRIQIQPNCGSTLTTQLPFPLKIRNIFLIGS